MPNTFKRNVLIAFGFSLLLLLLSSIASYISIQNLIGSAERVDHTNNVISELDNINIMLQEAESSQRGYLLTGEESFLVPYQAASKNISEKIANIKQLTADNPPQLQNVTRLEYLITQRFSILDLGIKARKDGTLVNNSVLLRGKEYMDETSSVISQMAQMERNLYEKRSERFRLLIIYTPIIIVIAAVLAILITIFFYGRIIADFRKRVELQDALQRKDYEIGQRLSLVKEIASKISSGDYKCGLAMKEKTYSAPSLLL
jgi:CHASE3 domain sensor protein